MIGNGRELKKNKVNSVWKLNFIPLQGTSVNLWSGKKSILRDKITIETLTYFVKSAAAKQMSIKVASHARLHSFTTGHLHRLLTRWTTFNLPQNMMVRLRGKRKTMTQTQQQTPPPKKNNQNCSFDVVCKISTRVC